VDFRDTSIITQVAFKGAIDLCRDIDVTTPQGQAEFTQAFSFLTDVLIEGVKVQAPAAEQAAEVIRGNFPGTTTVQQNPNGTYNPPPSTTPQAPPFQLTVKGAQNGPLPDWLWEQAAAKGVTEVYDNRDRAQGTKRPWFRSTTGGDDAPAFWPPR
jgi:hypothetical protein